MDRSSREALRRLEEITRSVATFEQVVLDDEYRRLIATVEAQPANQDGADKTAVLEQERALLAHYRDAREE